MLLPDRCTARRQGVLVVGLVACVLAGSSACTRRPPVAAPVPVALAVPPPPPRVISTPPERVAPTEASTVERPAPPARPQRASRAPARPEPTRAAEAPKVDAAEVPPLPAAEPAPAPGPLLRTPQTADESDAERRTQEVLGRAAGLLDKVNPQTLGTQARQQHETARRFVAQARQALTERNFVLASYLAEKAETLARGLSR